MPKGVYERKPRGRPGKETAVKKTPRGKNLQIIREDYPGFVVDNLEDIQNTASVLLAEGKSIEQLCDHIGISTHTYTYLRRKFPRFKDIMEAAAFEGSGHILEQLRDTPFSEPDAARARVKIEALARYLEMRWPDRFGKRVDVKIKSFDMADTLAKARERAGIAVISGTYEVLDTDNESVDGVDDLLS